MILYSHAPKAMNRSTGPIRQIISDIKDRHSGGSSLRYEYY
jgi:hypothetical protein